MAFDHVGFDKVMGAHPKDVSAGAVVENEVKILSGTDIGRLAMISETRILITEGACYFTRYVGRGVVTDEYYKIAPRLRSDRR
jgi:hypothetical protein